MRASVRGELVNPEVEGSSSVLFPAGRIDPTVQTSSSWTKRPYESGTVVRNFWRPWDDGMATVYMQKEEDTSAKGIHEDYAVN